MARLRAGFFIFGGSARLKNEMNKEQKTAAVAELSDRLKEAESIFAVDYRGISVTGAAELRARLREADASFKVVKNRLAKRAVEDAGAEGLDDLLVGPTALTLIKGDPVTAAKAISTFAREHDVLAYKGGIMDGEPLDADGFAAIARLPALEVLHGQLVGVAASPLTGLVRGLGSMVSGLAVALGQIAEQGLVGGEAQAEEPQTESEEAQPEEPDAEAEEPEAEAEEPEVEAEEPGSDAEEPGADAEEPGADAEKPEADAGEPGADAGEPEAAAESELPAAAEAAQGEGDEESSDETETETGGEQEPPDESEE